jgi:hypothetical protein
MKDEKPWSQDCCVWGHHLFDRMSPLHHQKSCRCGKVRGHGKRNVSALMCVACDLRSKKPWALATPIAHPKDRCWQCDHMRTFHGAEKRAGLVTIVRCSLCRNSDKRKGRVSSDPYHDFVVA